MLGCLFGSPLLSCKGLLTNSSVGSRRFLAGDSRVYWNANVTWLWARYTAPLVFLLLLLLQV